MQPEEGIEMVSSVGAGASFYLSSTNSSGKTASSESSDTASWVKERTSQLRSQFPNTSITISPAYLKKMESDPAIAAQGKELLDGIPAAQNWLLDKLQQNGIELVSQEIKIDDDGNMSSFSVVRTASDETENNSRQKLKEWLAKRDAGEPKNTALASVEDLFSRIVESNPTQRPNPSNPTRLDVYA